MKARLALAAVVLAGGCVLRNTYPPGAERPVGSAARDCFARVARDLSDDGMEGRGVGSGGLQRAGKYLEALFLKAGLEGPVDGSVFQPFEVQLGVSRGPNDRLTGGVSPTDDLPADQWTPLGFSSEGEFAGDVVFVGYGIAADELGYDDWAGVDVAGKVAVALRFEPGEDDDDSPFAGRRTSRWSDLRLKAFRAREAGAAALVIVEGPGGASGEEDRLLRLRARGPVSRAGLPVLQVKREVATRWLRGAGLDLGALQAEIDADYTPRSRPAPGLAVAGRVALEPKLATVRNVLGVLPGRGALASETVVVGAHYDHLGNGGAGSMSPDDDAIHNGADDNASGTAALVCAVYELAARERRRARDGSVPAAVDRRTVLFAAFTAEEIGLAGSSWYVEHPARPLESTVAMVNLDMVGRVRDGRLSALGTDSAAAWAERLPKYASRYGLELDLGGDGYGPSDQMSFYTRGVPVVHLFSGAHDAYHTPRDDFDTLNLEGGAAVTMLLADLVADLRETPAAPEFVASTSPQPLAGDSRNSGAWLGSIPDYTAMNETTGGVLLGGVKAGGPAERAGLRKGDRIVGFDGTDIQNLYDLTFALRDHRPNDAVEIRALRGEDELVFVVTLGRRSEMKASSPGDDPHAE